MDILKNLKMVASPFRVDKIIRLFKGLLFDGWCANHLNNVPFDQILLYVFSFCYYIVYEFYDFLNIVYLRFMYLSDNYKIEKEGNL